MRLYHVERSYDSFLIYPADNPREAVLCESVDAFADFCASVDDEDGFYLAPEAIDLLYGVE